MTQLSVDFALATAGGHPGSGRLRRACRFRAEAPGSDAFRVKAERETALLMALAGANGATFRPSVRQLCLSLNKEPQNMAQEARIFATSGRRVV